MAEPAFPSFGDALRTAHAELERQAGRRISNEDIARRLALRGLLRDRTNVGRWRRGETAPRPRVLRALAAIYNLERALLEAALEEDRLEQERGRFTDRTELSPAGTGSEGREMEATPSRSTAATIRVGAIALGLSLVGAFLIWQRFSVPGPLSHVKAEGTWLIAYAGEREAWRKALPAPARPGTPPLLLDVDRDGRPEVVHSVRQSLPRVTTERLVCYDEAGALRWSFDYGRSVGYQGREFSPYFTHLLLKAVAREDTDYLLAVSGHYRYFLTQVALLDASTGSLVGEYWHPGYLESVVEFDVFSDGSLDLVLGGVNNPGAGPGRASLLALKVPFGIPRSEPSLFGASNALELVYLLFPRIDRFDADQSLMSVVEVEAPTSDLVEASVGLRPGLVYYELDANLNALAVRASDTFVREHDARHLALALDHRFAEDELRELPLPDRFSTAPDANQLGKTLSARVP